MPSSKVDGEDRFLSHYQNCLSIVSLYQSGSGLVNSDHFLKSLDCLQAITGIEHHAYLGDVVGYTSEEDFIKDITAWGHWYSENMKSFSFDDAYKKFEAFRQANDYEITWPPMLVEIIIRPEQ
jgi:hypothetical protein